MRNTTLLLAALFLNGAHSTVTRRNLLRGVEDSAVPLSPALNNNYGGESHTDRGKFLNNNHGGESHTDRGKFRLGGVRTLKDKDDTKKKKPKDKLAEMLPGTISDNRKANKEKNRPNAGKGEKDSEDSNEVGGVDYLNRN
eukprot:CAMPEP_0194363810 /NCGR_PEP_ID=MMETSP0174-20130528/11672_1 /TAXON_ID=216777 /ORGANISM="Proboscia alata, Strain PI-D3" /LENGTH=139 /DNA_ID=CAMNT_0039137473 /DNA_START=55 /DNA_END=474 /DNA_ORIENTATION=-